MSLRAFHRVFIVAALATLGFSAWWAAGFGPSGEALPWMLWLSLGGAAALAPYFVWHLRKG